MYNIICMYVMCGKQKCGKIAEYQFLDVLFLNKYIFKCFSFRHIKEYKLRVNSEVTKSSLSMEVD